MTYRLNFLEEAEKEWRKLSPSLRDQFRRKLAEVLKHPHIRANKLVGMKDCYKIKLRSAGYRLVYRVFDDRVVVQVVVVGKRDRSEVYKQAEKRL